MADQKTEPKKAEQPKQQPKAAVAPLGDAGASTNPAVQQLLAHKAIAVSNGDDAAAAAVDAQLAGLGVQ